MTTTVKIEAHCADTKEVVVDTEDSGGLSGVRAVLQNGESHVTHAYDSRRIVVYEREKAPA